MAANIGSTDRVLRIVLGIFLLALIFLLEGAVRWVGLVGLVLIGTAIVGYCPAYGIFGMRTRRS
jgi:hypothetical protein